MYARDMTSVCTIDEPAVASAVLHPIRNRLLAELGEPASAAGLAGRMGLPRQRINYHLRELERLGLATVTEERPWGGLTERLFGATASAYVVSAKAMGPLAADPGRISDRLSAGYLMALGQRLATEVGDLEKRAKTAKKRLPTLSLDTVVCLGSAKKRAEFTRQLTDAIMRLVARYHEPDARGSRAHRLVVGAHPLPGGKARQEG
jgi:DNA-binding transcriptional ArsR family regulator